MRSLIILLLTSTLLLGWGKAGHRVIGKIAEENLSPKAKAEITKIIGHTDLVRVANWSDEIKSDLKWDHSHDWHYCTILDGREYEGPEAGGRAVQEVNEFTKLLKNGKLSDKNFVTNLDSVMPTSNNEAISTELQKSLTNLKTVFQLGYIFSFI